MRGVHPDQLRAFADVIELGSFTAAAARLNLTQPAVSQQVRQLEQRLKVRLIERSGRRATATAAGAELLFHIQHIEASILAALDAMARHATGAFGRVRIGTGATACIHLLPPILRDLRTRFPSLEITVTTGNTTDILKLIEDSRLDIGLVTMPAKARMLTLTPVVEDEFVLIGPSNSELPAKATPSALARMPIVLYEPGAHTRRIVDQWFARSGVALKPVMELGSVEAIKRLVEAGLGFGILPAMAVADARSEDKLVTGSLAPRLNRKLALVLRRDKRMDKGLREVVKALTAIAPSTARGDTMPKSVKPAPSRRSTE